MAENPDIPVVELDSVEDTLKKFGLRKIPPDEIILSPKLFN